MYSSQLEAILGHEPIVCKYFAGIFSCNTVPEHLNMKRYFYIVNTAPSFTSGEHWILIFVDEDKTIVFDSLANVSSFYSLCFKTFLKKLCSNSILIANEIQIQSNTSSSCGVYCIYFAIELCKQYSINTVMRRFTANKLENDKNIKHWFQRYLKIRRSLTGKAGQKCLSCRKWKK